MLFIANSSFLVRNKTNMYLRATESSEAKTKMKQNPLKRKPLDHLTGASFYIIPSFNRGTEYCIDFLFLVGSNIILKPLFHTVCYY